MSFIFPLRGYLLINGQGQKVRNQWCPSKKHFTVYRYIRWFYIRYSFTSFFNFVCKYFVLMRAKRALNFPVGLCLVCLGQSPPLNSEPFWNIGCGGQVCAVGHLTAVCSTAYKILSKQVLTWWFKIRRFRCIFKHLIPQSCSWEVLNAK